MSAVRIIINVFVQKEKQQTEEKKKQNYKEGMNILV